MGPEDLQASQLEAPQANLWQDNLPKTFAQSRAVSTAQHTKEMSNKAI